MRPKAGGLSDKAKNYEEEGIWPELRRAEANRFAYKLKLALEKTRVFGAVRVTPNQRASGDQSWKISRKSCTSA